MQALARANEVRLARAALKRDIGGGRRAVTDVITDSPWEAESMSLSELLCSQRRWGRARSRKLLSSAALSEAKKIGTLTERQRRILVHALEAKLARFNP
jgi:predicted DNA binding protein